MGFPIWFPGCVLRKLKVYSAGLLKTPADSSADERLIEAARRKARAVNRTLNDEFRAWLEDYVARDEQAARASALIDHLSQYASTGGRHFSRNDMNAR